MHSKEDALGVALIRDVVAKTGWSLSRVAREVGVSPSTITRALDPNHPVLPNGNTIERLRALVGSDPVPGPPRVAHKSSDLISYIAAVADGGDLPTAKQWDRILTLAGAK